MDARTQFGQLGDSFGGLIDLAQEAINSERNKPKEILYELIKEIDLVFQILAGGNERLSDAQIQKIEQMFRQAFLSVWERLPTADRKKILAYWRQKSNPLIHENWITAMLPKPLIQVRVGGGGSSPVPQKVGTQLIFSVPKVVGRAAKLPQKIALALAHVYRYATGAYWKLAIKMIEKPMERWETTGRQTEAACDKKHAELEAAYLLKHQAQVDAVLSRWGFGE